MRHANAADNEKNSYKKSEYFTPCVEENWMTPLAAFNHNQLVLQRSAPDLLEGLENLKGQRFPVLVTFEGYKHTKEIALALLICAHFYDVTVMIFPTKDGVEHPEAK
jgi:hypothetical protein